jgi:predicted RNA-binding Zn-ribbon protein involved in translation (DUF1610 family)
MFALKDILELLDRWPSWKKIQETPEHLETLEKRVAELEKRLERCPGEACPRCGELTYRTESSRLHPTFASVGALERTMKCEKCGFTEDVMITSKSRR